MNEPLEFKQNAQTLTLGVEAEYQLIDKETLQLVPRAPDLLDAVRHPRLIGEMFQSTIEVITGICPDAREAGRQLDEGLAIIRPHLDRLGIGLAGTGTNPLADYQDRLVSAGPRYFKLTERNQWLIRRMAVYGMHVHIGMADGDACIRYNNFFLQFIPHLIALSASSPFWRGIDTGLAAARPTAYEAHPTSGLPYPVNSWADFSALYANLVATGSIESMKDIWWDLRPSPRLGTLEIRICDGPATLYELEAIVAFVHMLAHWFQDHAGEPNADVSDRPPDWWLRENKWRAIRYGLDADLIRYSTLAPEPMRDNLHRWMERLAPYALRLEYGPQVEHLLAIIRQGNSASRQRAVFNRAGNMTEVVAFNMREAGSGEPDWSVMP
jgi:carboxylate-amine ligase